MLVFVVLVIVMISPFDGMKSRSDWLVVMLAVVMVCW